MGKKLVGITFTSTQSKSMNTIIIIFSLQFPSSSSSFINPMLWMSWPKQLSRECCTVRQRKKTLYYIQHDSESGPKLTVKFVKFWILLMNFRNDDLRNIFLIVIFDLPDGSSLSVHWLISALSSILTFLRIVKLFNRFFTRVNVFVVLFTSYW